MAFPSIAVQGSSSDDTADTSATVTLPAGTYTSGDLIVVAAGSRQAVASSPSTGWTILSDEGTANEGDCHVFWKESDGTESGGTMTFTASVATKHPGYTYVISGAADPSTDPPEISSVATGATGSPDPLGLTPTWATGEDNMFFAFAGYKSAVTATGYPNNGDGDSPTDTFTNASIGGGGACSISGCAYYSAQRNSCDPGAFTMSGSNDWEAFTVGVRPAAAGGGGPSIPQGLHGIMHGINVQRSTRLGGELEH